jgi:hypothetical protein
MARDVWKLPARDRWRLRGMSLLREHGLECLLNVAGAPIGAAPAIMAPPAKTSGYVASIAEAMAPPAERR